MGVNSLAQPLGQVLEAHHEYVKHLGRWQLWLNPHPRISSPAQMRQPQVYALFQLIRFLLEQRRRGAWQDVDDSVMPSYQTMLNSLHPTRFRSKQAPLLLFVVPAHTFTDSSTFASLEALLPWPHPWISNLSENSDVLQIFAQHGVAITPGSNRIRKRTRNRERDTYGWRLEDQGTHDTYWLEDADRYISVYHEDALHFEGFDPQAESLVYNVEGAAHTLIAHLEDPGFIGSMNELRSSTAPNDYALYLEVCAQITEHVDSSIAGRAFFRELIGQSDEPSTTNEPLHPLHPEVVLDTPPQFTLQDGVRVGKLVGDPLSKVFAHLLPSAMAHYIEHFEPVTQPVPPPFVRRTARFITRFYDYGELVQLVEGHFPTEWHQLDWAHMDALLQAVDAYNYPEGSDRTRSPVRLRHLGAAADYVPLALGLVTVLVEARKLMVEGTPKQWMELGAALAGVLTSSYAAIEGMHRRALARGEVEHFAPLQRFLERIPRGPMAMTGLGLVVSVYDIITTWRDLGAAHTRGHHQQAFGHALQAGGAVLGAASVVWFAGAKAAGAAAVFGPAGWLAAGAILLGTAGVLVVMSDKTTDLETWLKKNWLGRDAARLTTPREYDNPLAVEYRFYEEHVNIAAQIRALWSILYPLRLQGLQVEAPDVIHPPGSPPPASATLSFRLAPAMAFPHSRIQLRLLDARGELVWPADAASTRWVPLEAGNGERPSWMTPPGMTTDPDTGAVTAWQAGVKLEEILDLDDALSSGNRPDYLEIYLLVPEMGQPAAGLLADHPLIGNELPMVARGAQKIPWGEG